MITSKQRNALVVGGTDGVGKEIAFGLAQTGYHLIIVGRDEKKGMLAKSQLQRATGNNNIEFLKADVSLMYEVDRLTDRVVELWKEVHLLVLNAGIIFGRREITKEGIELNFAVNYLSRFAIAKRLLPLLIKGGTIESPSRILVVSGAALNGTIYYNDVNLTNNFSLIRFVAQQCQANDVFTVELARRLISENCFSVTINNYKLGVVKTSIRKDFPKWMKWMVLLFFDPLLGMNPKEAAAPALQLLLNREFEKESGGLYLKVMKFKKVKPSRKTSDSAEGARLWNLSVRMSTQYRLAS